MKLRYALLVGAAVATTSFGSAEGKAETVVVNALPSTNFRPGSPGYGQFSDEGGQTFLVKFTIRTSTLINGMDILGGCNSACIGHPVSVQLFQNSDDSPSALIFAFDSEITSVPIYSGQTLVYTQFASITLRPGSYWIGMYGAEQEEPGFEWDGYPAGPETIYNQYIENSYGVLSPFGGSALAFQIEGVSGVPEPATWAMMLLGFAGLGFVGYRASLKSAAMAM